MTPRAHPPALRLVAFAVLGALLLGCGSGSSGSRRDAALVGGVLPPNPIAYALTLTSDPAFAIAGCGGGSGGLPPRVDLQRDGTIPPVQNQRWNSCVAWTFGYYLMSAIHARRVIRRGEVLEKPSGCGDEEPDGPPVAVDISDPDHWFSPDFLYSQRDRIDARLELAPDEPICLEFDGEVGCMRPEKALRLLLERGCARWTWMCTDTESHAFRACGPDQFDYRTVNSRRAWAGASVSALRYRPRCYVRFGTLSRASDPDKEYPLDDMKAWLAEERTPIACVVQMHAGWVGYEGGNRGTAVLEARSTGHAVEERGVCLDAVGTDLGSQHMMTIIGYDDTWPSAATHADLPPEKQGSFLVINQWGTKWGDAGLMWIPYAELRKIWLGGYGLIADDDLADDNPSVDPDPRCVQEDDGRWGNLQQGDDVPRNLVDGVVTTTATIMEDGDILGDGVGDADTGDWFAVEITEPNTFLTVMMEPDDACTLLDAKLADADLRRLGSLAQARDGVREFTRLLCAPGLYYMKVHPVAASESGSYTFGIATRPAQIDELDDDICGAQELGAGIPTTAKPGAAGPAALRVAWSADLDGSDRCDWATWVAPRTTVLGITLQHRETQGIRCNNHTVLDVWRGATPDTAVFAGRAQRAVDPTPTPEPGAPWACGLAQLRLPVVAGERLFLSLRNVIPGEQEVSVSLVDELDPAYAQTPAGATELVFSRRPPPAGEPPDTRLRLGATVEGVIDPGAGPYALAYHTFVAPPEVILDVALTSLGAGSSLFASVFTDLGDDGPSDVAPAGEAIRLGLPDDGAHHRVTIVVAYDPGLDASVAPYRLEVGYLHDPLQSDNAPGAVGGREVRAGERVSGLLPLDDPIDWIRLTEVPNGAIGVLVALEHAGAQLELIMPDALGFRRLVSTTAFSLVAFDLPPTTGADPWLGIQRLAGESREGD